MRFHQKLIRGIVVSGLIDRFRLRRVVGPLVGPVYWRPLEDFETITIEPNAYLVAFWKDLPNGRGPGFSLYVYEHEIPRYDCLGGEAGHRHVLGVSDDSPAMPFGNTTRKQQVEASFNELPTACLKYLPQHTVQMVRAFRLDLKKVEKASEQARRWMLEFLYRENLLEHELQSTRRTGEVNTSADRIGTIAEP